MTIMGMLMSLDVDVLSHVLSGPLHLIYWFLEDIHKGRSSHWGTFLCKATNPLGQDTAEITLTGAKPSELVLMMTLTMIMLMRVVMSTMTRKTLFRFWRGSKSASFPIFLLLSFSPASNPPSPAYHSLLHPHHPLSPSNTHLRLLQPYSFLECLSKIDSVMSRSVMEQISISRKNVIAWRWFMCVIDVIQWNFATNVKIWLASWLYEIYESQRNNFTGLVFITHQMAIALELIHFDNYPTSRILLSSFGTNTCDTQHTQTSLAPLTC